MQLHLVSKKKLAGILLIGLVFVLGFVLGIRSGRNTQGTQIAELREKGYRFISPLLDYQELQETQAGDMIGLKRDLEKHIHAEVEKGSITEAAVYIRELNNGPWIGINERMLFSPASLLKVPILIAILKKVETDPGLLAQKIKNIPVEDGVMQVVEPSHPLKDGESYTVWELIEHMILYSDNRAKNLLLITFKDKDFERVYQDLGVSLPSPSDPEDFMSVRNYASFFRVLYNASYLNHEMSNKALELLSRVEYRQGLVAGLPEGTVLSHKFGERLVNGQKQLHDCGIVYYPNNPTILCVMTRGAEGEPLAQTIREIARKSHEVISKETRQ